MHWDQQAVRVRYEVAPAGEQWATITFRSVFAIFLGAPNEEAIERHRLWGRGLKLWTFMEAPNSDWIADLERRNRVHSRHNAEHYRELRHVICVFQDETLECPAHEFHYELEIGK